jgi:hypothetical protein
VLGSGAATSGIVGQLAGGVVGGTVLMAVIGLLKRVFMK